MGGAPAPLGPPPNQVIIDADYQMIVRDAERKVGPRPPAWYVPQPPLDPETVKTDAKLQQQDHALRVLNQAWMDRRLGFEVAEIFASDEEYVKAKEIEPQVSPLLRIIFDAIVNFVSSQTISFSSLARGLVNKEERALIESHLIDALTAIKDTHFREGQGSFTRTLCADLLSGMAAIYHHPDPGDERAGQRVYRVDPKVVYPVFGRDGLDYVYTVYDASYPEVLRDFGDGYDEESGKPNPATAAIQKIARKGTGRGNKAFDQETKRELIGCWNRKEAMVLWDGQVIKRHEHRLWRVPWHVFVPNWRNTAGSKAQSPYLITDDRNAPTDENGLRLGSNGSGDRARDLARTYEPFLTTLLPTIGKIEKGMTRFGYGVDRALSEPLVWIRSQANAQIGTPEPQNFRNGVMEIQQDESVDTLPMKPLNESFAPWMELLKLEIQAVIPTPILQGQSIGTQASGNALDVINEMGFSHFSPVVEAQGLAYQEIGHTTLVYKRDWASAYDPASAGGGYGVDPVRQGGASKLTKEMLERAGCYVECTLSRFSLNGMVAAASAASILDQQLHIGTREEWVRRFGLSPKPSEMVDARRDQDMDDAPGYVEAEQISHLYDQMREAAELGDDESLRRIGIKAKRVAAKQTMHDIQIAKMAGLMPPQPEPMPGELPGNAGQPGGNPMPYLSAPDVGREVGTEGGAPVGAPPIPGQV